MKYCAATRAGQQSCRTEHFELKSKIRSKSSNEMSTKHQNDTPVGVTAAKRTDALCLHCQLIAGGGQVCTAALQWLPCSHLHTGYVHIVTMSHHQKTSCCNKSYDAVTKRYDNANHTLPKQYLKLLTLKPLGHALLSAMSESQATSQTSYE